MRSFLRSKFAKAFAWSTLAVALLFAIFWIHLLNQVGLDDWLERRFLQYASYGAAKEEVDKLLLIEIDPSRTEGLGAFDDDITANQAWRTHHAALLRKLADAGAHVVAFDLSFPATDNEANKALVDAIKDVNGAGKTVAIVGYERDMDDNPALEAVLPRKNMGLVSMREMAFAADSSAYLARVLLAESTVKIGPLGAEEHVARPLPMPLALYLERQRPRLGAATLKLDPAGGALVVDWDNGPPTYITTEIRTCEIGTPGCAAPEGSPKDDTILRRAVVPLWMGRALNFTQRTYASVLTQNVLGGNYSDRVVIVGAKTAGEKQQLGPGAPPDVFGMHVHARIFSDLVTGHYPRRAPALLQLASFVLVLLAGIAARLYMPIKVVKIPVDWLKDFPLPVGFFLTAALYLFIAAAIFRSQYVFFDLGYQLLALAAGYYGVTAFAGLVSPEVRTESKPAGKKPGKKVK